MTTASKPEAKQGGRHQPPETLQGIPKDVAAFIGNRLEGKRSSATFRPTARRQVPHPMRLRGSLRNGRPLSERMPMSA